eukprot:CAMPEP_0174856038 /NCGR_PEP_ID=MMETSP1114-20130205/34928_1 /TAXON_ID=312471 /ORGANISM="Neobodo designis, Strain CCAP 1951/1" /LENGTH=97 /DNA_ID=CAMNT_0016090813 /DNA_START=127 /DNA_END=420 /DNA_ORIENTATION=+
MEAQVAALEKRAAALEAKANAIGSSPAPSNDATLARLTEIKKAIEQDKAEAEAVRAERDALAAENAALKTQIGKHQYRIEHLLNALKEADEKIASKK